MSPGNRFAFVRDLGLDRVLAYRIDPSRAALEPCDPAFAAAPPGAGPRHSAFSADGRHLYVANEMGNSVSLFAREPGGAALQLRQTVSTLPPGFRGEDTAGEIRLGAGGRFLYVSNRGHDSLAVFARRPETGLLERLEIVPCGGGHPRNFALTADGRWLLCANRDSGNVVVFSVDPATGRLLPAGGRALVPEPVCVLISGCPGAASAPP